MFVDFAVIVCYVGLEILYPFGIVLIRYVMEFVCERGFRECGCFAVGRTEPELLWHTVCTVLEGKRCIKQDNIFTMRHFAKRPIHQHEHQCAR